MKKITLMLMTTLSILCGSQASAQFSESFDAGIPANWTVLNEDGGEHTWLANLTYPRTGAGNVRIRWEAAAHNDFLISPAIAVTAGLNDQFSFWAGIDGTFWTEAFEVRVSTTGTAAADFTTIGSATAVTNVVIGDYTKYVYNLTPYVGQNIYVAIVAVDTDRFYLYVDDAVSDALPSCIAPTDGVATVTSSTTADLTWVSGGSENAEVYIATAGSPAPDTANDTGENTTGNTFAAIGLIAQTAYVFYVRAECTDGTEFSEWSGPFAFDTTQVPGCVTPISPADGAIDVPVGEVTFEWTAPTTGDPATSYDMYYGLTADDVTNFVGNFVETTALININGFDTTLFWTIVPINAGGEATACGGTAWSFTTVSPPPAPVNDECSGAIVVNAAANFAAGAILGTNAGATVTETAIPSCQADVDASVWYSVVVPASGNITLETQSSTGTTLTDTILVAYTGDCAALTAIGCDDDGGAVGVNNFFSVLPLTGQTPGSTIYVSVYRYGSSAGAAGEFQFAAYDASLATSTFDSAAFTSYPNPVTNMLNLSYNKNITAATVYNLLGQVVLTQAIGSASGQIDMSALNSGTYLVKVTSDNEVKTLKIVKQ